MFERHDESTAVINASVTEVFAHLDDQTRLSAHMSKRSWKTGWGKMEVRLDTQGGKAADRASPTVGRTGSQHG